MADMSIAVKCTKCGDYFDSGVHANSREEFDTMEFQDCMTRCHHCNQLTPYNINHLSFIGTKTE